MKKGVCELKICKALLLLIIKGNVNKTKKEGCNGPYIHFILIYNLNLAVVQTNLISQHRNVIIQN